MRAIRQTIFSVNRRRRGSRPSGGLWRDERGSFSLEATVVMPYVLTSVLLLLLASLLVYQSATLYYSASTAAERAAFRWDNSHRDAVTAMHPPGMYDGLYWRLGEDRMLEGVFGGLTGGEQAAEVALPADAGRQDGGETAERKMLAAGGRVDKSLEGRMSYRNDVLLRTVAVELKSPFGIAAAAPWFGAGGGGGRASSTVVDPVEFIRTVELARYYADKFDGDANGSAKRARAAAVLRERAPGGAA